MLQGYLYIPFPNCCSSEILKTGFLGVFGEVLFSTVRKSYTYIYAFVKYYYLVNVYICKSLEMKFIKGVMNISFSSWFNMTNSTPLLESGMIAYMHHFSDYRLQCILHLLTNYKYFGFSKLICGYFISRWNKLNKVHVGYKYMYTIVKS